MALIFGHEFVKTFQACGLALPSEVYVKYQTLLTTIKNAEIVKRDELAMFLANVYHESNGFLYTCKIKPSQEKYIGRGYLPLTHEKDYAEASMALFGDLRLHDKPEMVENEDLAWRTAAWFWKKRVRATLPVNFSFKSCLRAINKGELDPGAGKKLKERIRRRIKFYAAICRVLGLNGRRQPSLNEARIHIVQTGLLWIHLADSTVFTFEN